MIGFGFSVFTQAILGAGGFAKGSSLALDFTSGNRRLDPRITFSRTTNATLTNSAGLVAYAPHNLLTYSEQFDNAVWTKRGTCTVTANAFAAPDGTTTADLVTGLGSLGSNDMYFGGAVSGSPATTTVLAPSFYIKKVSSTGTLRLQNAGGNTYGVWLIDLSLLSTGWERITPTHPAVTVSTTYTGTGGSTAGPQFNATAGTLSFYIWGAQLELGSTATTYNPTTVKNLLGYTEHFDNAAWTKSNATITSGFTDIYGQPFAQSITSGAANATVLSSYTAVASTPYTFSVYLQRVSGTGNVDISVDGTNWVTQTLTTTLKRFTVTGSPTAGAKTPGIRVVSSGDVIIAFGAQLSDSASVDPYVYRPVAAPSAAAYYGPRFDYDPVTLAPKGLLIEEQRTQLLLNSSFAGTSLATQNVTVTAVAHTLSFYGTGTVTLSGTSTAGPLVGSGAYPTRSTLTFTPTAGTLTLTVTGTVQFAQLEVGAFATSFIPSAASQVTRAADSASMIGNNFARWYTQGVGTIFSQFDTPASGNRPVVSLDDNTANNMIRLRTEATDPYFRVITGGVAQADLDAGTVAANTIYKMAGGFGSNNFLSCINAGTVGSDTSGTVPTVDRLRIGSDQAGAYLNGHIARTSYYSRVLTSTEDQGITS